MTNEPLRYLLCLLSSAWAFTHSSQALSEWRHSTKNDPLHGVSFDEFILDGRYLTSPAHTDQEAPKFVLHCSRGEFIEGCLVVGRVLDRNTNGKVTVERRRDGKYDVDYWGTSTDGQAAFLPGAVGLLDFLYGHLLPHKEGKGELLHQEIYGVREAYGATISMQFDMPKDQSQVLESCTTVKRGKRY